MFGPRYSFLRARTLAAPLGRPRPSWFFSRSIASRLQPLHTSRRVPTPSTSQPESQQPEPEQETSTATQDDAASAAGQWIVAPVPHRAVYRCSGKDTYKFLQGLLTNDLKLVQEGADRLLHPPSEEDQVKGMDAVYAGLLTPQGRMVADLFLYPEPTAGPEPSVLLDLDRRVAQEALTLIGKFKLRSKVTLVELGTHRVGQVFFVPPEIPSAVRDY